MIWFKIPWEFSDPMVRTLQLTGEGLGFGSLVGELRSHNHTVWLKNNHHLSYLAPLPKHACQENHKIRA